MATAKIDELVQVLKDRGLNEEAIETVKDELLSHSGEKFMAGLLDSLAEQDLGQVEAIQSQEEANKKLAEIYKQKTGRDMQEDMGKAIDEAAIHMIEKYKVGASTGTKAEEPEEVIHDL